jgi:YfiH family protein
MSFTEFKYGALVLMKAGLLEQTGKVRHAFTTRYGGVSDGKFTSLNLAVNRGDRRENVLNNYRILCNALQTEPSRLVFSSQVHEDEVRIVTAGDQKTDLFDAPPYNADGLITAEKELPLIIFTADCIPILLYGEDAKENGVAAAVHAGWRGTVMDIAGKAVRKMQSRFGVIPSSIRAAIGPGIGPCCFETGPEVLEEVRKLRLSNLTDFTQSIGGKLHIDLKGLNRALLAAAGLGEENIEISDECTMCSSKKYWSHRATRGERGTQAAIICLS